MGPYAHLPLRGIHDPQAQAREAQPLVDRVFLKVYSKSNYNKHYLLQLTRLHPRKQLMDTTKNANKCIVQPESQKNPNEDT
jgi:hypothetical protein